MAKYKLTKVSYYEDNEQAGDDNYNQQHVQGVADAKIAYRPEPLRGRLQYDQE